MLGSINNFERFFSYPFLMSDTRDMSEQKHRTGAGDSNMARSFGASVDVRLQSDSLSLVVARERSPKALIQGAGGKVAIELSPTTVIAALPLATHLSFRNHPDLRFIGPVTLDPARYAQFMSVLQQRTLPLAT
jgi:hypothetical protein